MSRKLCKTVDNISWKDALTDAQNKLKEAKASVANWESVVRTCQKRMAEGEPWPMQIAGQSEGRQHSV